MSFESKVIEFSGAARDSLRALINKLGGSASDVGMTDLTDAVNNMPPLYTQEEADTAIEEAIDSQTTETWTFTMMDGGTVTKKILVK